MVVAGGNGVRSSAMRTSCRFLCSDELIAGTYLVVGAGQVARAGAKCGCTDSCRSVAVCVHFCGCRILAWVCMAVKFGQGAFKYTDGGVSLKHAHSGRVSHGV